MMKDVSVRNRGNARAKSRNVAKMRERESVGELEM